MTARDLFLLAIRILGLVFFYHGLMALPTTLFGAFASLFGGAPLGFFGMGFMALWPLLLAQWFLRGAPLLMRWAYPVQSSAPFQSPVPPVQP